MLHIKCIDPLGMAEYAFRRARGLARCPLHVINVIVRNVWSLMFLTLYRRELVPCWARTPCPTMCGGPRRRALPTCDFRSLSRAHGKTHCVVAGPRRNRSLCALVHCWIVPSARFVQNVESVKSRTTPSLCVVVVAPHAPGRVHAASCRSHLAGRPDSRLGWHRALD